jgi:SAM-dependent methyltransferase
MNFPPNYEYILSKASVERDNNGRILDYGCGKGRIVEEGLRRGMPIFGCELFGAGSGIAIRDYLSEKGLFGDTVREITEGKIPFPDGYFDLVVSNQVFEHVPHLGPVLAEISRVLSPSGKLLCLFPVQESYRDHAGTLFAHWFPSNSRAQYFCLLFFRSFGFGRLKKGRGTPREWSEYFVQWLLENTWYRSVKEIDETFGRYFTALRHIEEDYISFRLKAKGLYSVAKASDTWLGKCLFQHFSIRWGSVVMLIQKKSQ